MKNETHQIYDQITSDYKFLFEPNIPPIADEDYIKQFKLDKNAFWYPYVGYYKIDLLNDLKENFLYFSGKLYGSNIMFRATYQFSKETFGHGFLVKHPEAKSETVLYFDIMTLKAEEFLELFNNKFKKHEFLNEEKLGFFPIRTTQGVGFPG